ncbi:hypothetical protein GQR58_001015 [Nymphon striatum]|nr:hypothetical protein GQR58_001015 [Nymphon striatum]
MKSFKSIGCFNKPTLLIFANSDSQIPASPPGHLESLCRAVPRLNRLKMKLPVCMKNSGFMDTRKMLKKSFEDKLTDPEKGFIEKSVPAWNSAFEVLAPQTNLKMCLVKLHEAFLRKNKQIGVSGAEICAEYEYVLNATPTTVLWIPFVAFIPGHTNMITLDADDEESSEESVLTEGLWTEANLCHIFRRRALQSSTAVHIKSAEAATDRRSRYEH